MSLRESVKKRRLAPAVALLWALERNKALFHSELIRRALMAPWREVPLWPTRWLEKRVQREARLRARTVQKVPPKKRRKVSPSGRW